MSHATAFDFASASTKPQRIRTMYRLRESLGSLHRDLFNMRTPTELSPTSATSGSALAAGILYSQVTSESPWGSTFGQAYFGEQGDAAEAIGTVSDAVSAVTAEDVPNRALAENIDVLLGIAREEQFEDGMNSNLSVGLRVLFRMFSSNFSKVLSERLAKGGISARVLTEILYTLGQIEDDNTKEWRLATLSDHLRSPSPAIRDAAAVGLAYLDDKRALPYLREAIERESSETLKEDIRAVVEQITA